MKSCARHVMYYLEMLSWQLCYQCDDVIFHVTVMFPLPDIYFVQLQPYFAAPESVAVN